MSDDEILDTSPPVIVEERVQSKEIVPRKPEGYDFDWSDSSSVVLPDQHAVAIYFNPEGELVICQRNWPDDDTHVFINAGNIEGFLDKLCDVCGVLSAGNPSK